MKTKKTSRKKKFIVWLCNHWDPGDDEWTSIWAKSKEEAFENVDYNASRFSKGSVFTVEEFRK